MLPPRFPWARPVRSDGRHGSRCLGFLFLTPIQTLKIRLGRGFGFFECGFLAPVDHFRRTGLLHDPVINLSVLARVEQNIGDVIPDG